jgi:hypothetical protein
MFRRGASLNDKPDEKWLLEEGAALDLIEALNLKYGFSFEIIRHSDRPDVVIEDRSSGARIGVEVTHLFYDSDEARMIFGRSLNQERVAESIEECLLRLNALLQQKAEKSRGYDHEAPLGLLVRVVSQVFKHEEFHTNAPKILVPVSDFKYIWLLFYDFHQKRWSNLEQLM